ncbi:MAG TPA: hypothetical protein PKN86_11150 [Candidatus Obscuribacter sp.]|nr:hypothetical protein [Candidatus Obscuribacter sp.]MBK9282233.1 hypothetical protein [Candidatus Obscuribacter sp.]MBL8085801.1 hypothetical protein [Candidatus Obscuribacter sp.]HMY53592.1 hypothetical protein [Candidatus Obscuribacter sp.]HNH76062.1 hypothetical protein [Candidatus Obscuribacter sp.]
MSNSTKLILLGLGICVVLGIALQGIVANNLQSSMSGSELLTPDQAAKKAQKDALKQQKERSQQK